MGIKLISKEGDMLPLTLRMFESGVDTLAYLNKPDCKMHDRMQPKVESTTELDIQPNDTVLFDMVGAGRTADYLKDKGYTVIGAGLINDRLELDRDFGDSFMEQHGIPTPKSTAFTDFDEAIKFVRETGKRYVFKPNGNLDTSLTFASSSAKEMLLMLPLLRQQVPDGTEFELQEFIDGVEMSTEAWFNGERFILPVNSTMEEKKLLAGGLGPNTGCMGNVVWYWDDEISQLLYEILFRPLEPALADAGYLGPLDINAIWTPEGPYGLEFTARFGYDAIQASERLLDGSLADFLQTLPNLDRVPLESESRDYSCSVRVSVPPYPNDGEVQEVPITSIGKSDKDHIYFADTYVDQEGALRCSGFDGYVLAIAENDKTVDRALKRIYRVAERLEIPGKQYRIDIGERVATEALLVEGYIRGMTSQGVA
jgi:phosphoribosylamine--glycine ligase